MDNHRSAGSPALLSPGCIRCGAAASLQKSADHHSGRLLYVILAVNAFTVIMHLMELDAFILIAIALLGGGAGLLHIIITTLLIWAGRPWASRF